MFVSGGMDGRVLLWPTKKAAGDKWKPEPITMEIVAVADGENQLSVYCLAVSPDNQIIFSGRGDDDAINALFIHDANT